MSSQTKINEKSEHIRTIVRTTNYYSQNKFVCHLE
jgi:hypothetical protein